MDKAMKIELFMLAVFFCINVLALILNVLMILKHPENEIFHAILILAHHAMVYFV